MEDVLNYEKKSFIKKLGIGILNFVISLIAGLLCLVVLMFVLTIIFGPMDDNNNYQIVETFYGGGVTAIGLMSILSFFYAFKGFNIVDKVKNFKREKVAPKELGKLLGDVLRETLSEQFKRQNLLKTQEQFIKKGWNFDLDKYSFEIMNMYVNMIQLTITKKFSTASDPQKLVDNFIESLPKKYIEKSNKQFLGSYFELLKSDQPLLTVSRRAAQNYFGEEVGMEEIMHFSASAKAFDEVLNAFSRDLNMK